MATNVEKSKTKKTNCGAGVLSIEFGDKELLQVAQFAMIANEDVKENSLIIGELKTHECVYDNRKKIAKRIMEDGTEIEVNGESIEKFAKIAEKIRKNQEKDEK